MSTRPIAAEPLPLTGERTVPGVAIENYWFQRHVVAYQLAAARSTGKVVVDAGSGEGYGTAMLGATAAEAIGIELVDTVVDHARRTYPDQRFLTADICETGLADGMADVIVNLQVIEHLPDVGRFLGEAHRVLGEDGELIVATPNRLTFTPHSHEPTNIFHVQEFTAAELVQLLEEVGGFDVTRVLGLYHGPRIRAAEAAGETAFTDLVLAPPETWQPWVSAVVRRVRPEDFVWVDTPPEAPAIDDCLDLLVMARRPVDGSTR